MVTLYLFLLVLYLALAFLYALTPPPQTPVSPWPVLPTTPSSASHRAVSCQVDADCDPHHLCLSRTCVPKLLKGGQCDSETGTWIAHLVKGVTFALCSCLDPRLFDQNFFGGNCDVSVACGEHGVLDPVTKTCHCHPGYKAQGLTCQKASAFDAMTACQPDELPLAALHPTQNKYFHADYLAHIGQPTCVKRPCSFEAVSGRPLKHTKFDATWGCVCDPSYGLFGVQLELSGKRYLKTPGFDACASLFEREQPMDVQLVTYFYLRERPPVSLILYEKGPSGRPMMIYQEQWRYDFAQHFFKHRAPFRARTRKKGTPNVFGIYRTEDGYTERFKPPFCSDLRRGINQMDERTAYNLLYENPVCFVGDHDPRASALFWGRVVLNPHHLTLKDFREMHRVNAFVLQYDRQLERWSLEEGSPYKMDVYLSSQTNAPFL